eukprot:TRINITY_DN22559_c0_g1_i1.p1 TRINITY_DN22559_c0_g1~~TRINITY_DN22559_c0_g1_i1.p1  ORF type:complete len:283 (+),score=60.35 TRINITY_DN22559_c0_g1_i1:61-909(+)
MIRRPPRSTLSSSSAASDVYKRQVYADRRVTSTADGFIEQHTTCFVVHGRKVEMPCLIRCGCNSDGLIVSLEEYLDPSPLMNALAKPPPAQAVEQPSQPPHRAVVVVTGASSGIGEEIALKYASYGCTVVLAGRRKAELERVSLKCRAVNPRSHNLVVPVDLSIERDCAQLIAITMAEFGNIDRLVLNAGISQSCRLEDSSAAMLRQLMDVNFFGSALVALHALPHLHSSARIVCVSSALGKLAAPTQTGYCASKWACHGFFESLRCEVQPSGVTVTVACPG